MNLDNINAMSELHAKKAIKCQQQITIIRALIRQYNYELAKERIIILTKLINDMEDISCKIMEDSI